MRRCKLPGTGSVQRIDTFVSQLLASLSLSLLYYKLSANSSLAAVNRGLHNTLLHAQTNLHIHSNTKYETGASVARLDMHFINLFLFFTTLFYRTLTKLLFIPISHSQSPHTHPLRCDQQGQPEAHCQG